MVQACCFNPIPDKANILWASPIVYPLIVASTLFPFVPSWASDCAYSYENSVSRLRIIVSYAGSVISYTRSLSISILGFIAGAESSLTPNFSFTMSSFQVDSVLPSTALGFAMSKKYNTRNRGSQAIATVTNVVKTKTSVPRRRNVAWKPFPFPLRGDSVEVKGKLI